jgi:hypothetical protein
MVINIAATIVLDTALFVMWRIADSVVRNGEPSGILVATPHTQLTTPHTMELGTPT